jgi:hypothetical protein
MRYTDGSVAAEIYGFAVCFPGDTIYRFSCDRADQPIPSF